MLLIVVTPDGDVQNRILHTDRPYTQSQLIEATNFFNQHFAGQSFRRVRARLADELQALREDIVGADDGGGRRRRAARCTEREALVVTGERNLLDGERPRVEHGAAAPALRALRAEDVAAAPARRLAARARACRSTSAASRGWCRSTRCSVVTAPYEVDGRVIGTLGVIGPTRMAYERVIPIVDVTAKLLSNALTQQLTD